MKFEPNEIDMLGEIRMSANRRGAKAAFSTLGISASLILIVSTLVSTAAVLILDRAAPGWRSWPYSMWLLGFAPLYLAAFPVGLAVAHRTPAFLPERGTMTAGRYLCVILICVFVMQVGNIAGLVLQELVRGVLGGDPVNPLESFANDRSLPLRILFLVILAPLIEEFFFRRVLIDRMRPYGEKLAVVTSAAMFGLFHGNLAQMFYAFTLGLVFGWVYLRTGRLRYTVGLHMIINFFFGVLSAEIIKWAGPALEELEKLSDPTAATAADVSALSALLTPGVIAYFLYLFLLFAAMIAGLVLLIVRGRRVRFQPTPLELPRGQRFSTAWVNVGMILFSAICVASVVLNIL